MSREMPEIKKRWSLGQAFQSLTVLVDGASLAVFRIVFGLAMAWDAVPYLQKGWISRKFLEPTFHFPYFDWLKPLPNVGLHAVFVTILISGWFVAVGFVYRISSIVLFISFTYVFLLDRTEYLNHFYLMCLLSLILCFVPAHRVWSLDRRLGWVKGPPLVPQWSLDWIRAQLFVVYFFGGIAKIDGDWLSGATPYLFLNTENAQTVFGRLASQPEFAIVLAWSGMLFDLLIVFFLIWRKTRWLAFLAVVIFHVINSMWFTIGVFPWLMLAVTPIFFEPGWPRTFRGLVSAKATDKSINTSDTSALRRKLSPRFTVGIAIILLLVQLIVPLRLHFIPSNASWSMEGHYFAWRMMLYFKQGRMAIRVTRPASGKVINVAPQDDMRFRQYRKMLEDPYSIRQYARYLAVKYGENDELAKVQVMAQVSLNGREPQLVFDPEIDLANTTAKLVTAAPWITPLKKPRRSPYDLQAFIAQSGKQRNTTIQSP